MSAERWRGTAGMLQQRNYPSYQNYLAHQGEKLTRMKPGRLAVYELAFQRALQQRLMSSVPLPIGSWVLCLGARGGAEVRAFFSYGCRAIGIDVNPGPRNPYVMTADFHALPFGAETFGTIFTNALDHCYDVGRVLAEARRVLSPAGRFIVEAVRGTNEGCAAGSYESMAWETIGALIRVIVQGGFTLDRRGPAFDCPWPGEHLIFRRAEVS